jgi:glycosyltransferase involved in cell wall biosynthesis
MISIIIPVYNEETVLARCLDNILKDPENEFEVIVVCNGCIDNSRKVAESYGSKVNVIALEQASKILALNTGDEFAHYFPRFYIDADIIISADTIKKVAALLNQEQFLAAAPKINFDISNANFFVRQFYKIWQLNPYFTNMIGSGVYALSEQGRSRFDKFPPIIDDDEYVRIHFNDAERKTVDSCNFTVVTPTNLTSLVKIKTRARLGSYELKMKYPQLIKKSNKNYRSFMLTLLSTPSLWIGSIIYLYVIILTRFLAKKRLKAGNFIWDKDNSSRV